MKRFLMLLMFSAMFFVTTASANFTPSVEKMLAENDVTAPAAEEGPAPAEEKSDFPNFVCVDSVTYSLIPKNIDKAIFAEGTPSSFITKPGSEKFDKKNKVFTVWIIEIHTFQGKESILADKNEYGKEVYKNIGYNQMLVKFDTKTKKYKYMTVSEYNCDGSVIKTYGEQNWDYIMPDSVFEEIYIQLKKKFKM